MHTISTLRSLSQGYISLFTDPVGTHKRLHQVLYFGFVPAVIYFGMQMEPKPSWLELVNFIE